MALFQTQVTLIHPTTQVPTAVEMWINGPSQAYADGVSSILDQLTAFTGNAAALRALAAQLIIDIDAQG